MQAPAIPDDEAARLEALHKLEILDTPAEERFDRVTRLVRQAFATQFALVSLVDADRQWFKSRQGMEACETGRDVSFCGHAILDHDLLVVEDAVADPRFFDNPLVTGEPNIRFYAGAPLISQGGHAIGTLCVIDSIPRHFSAEHRRRLRDYADIVQTEINLEQQRQLQAAFEEAQISTQRQLATMTTLLHIASSPSLTIAEQLQRALSFGVDHLGLEMGIISEIYDNIYCVKAFHAPDSSGLSIGQVFECAHTYCSITLLKGDVLAIHSMGHSQYRGHPCYSMFGLESYIGIAIEVCGVPFGTLNFSSSKTRLTSFDESEKIFLRLLGSWVSAVIERDENQQRLRKIAEQVPGTVFQLQRWPDGRTTFPYASPGIKDIYGLSPQEVRDNADVVFKSIHSEDLARVEETINRSAADLSLWHCQYRVVKPDGKIRWVEGTSTPERISHGSIVWHGYIHDITDQKAVEQDILIRKARLRALFELSPLGIALLDYDTGKFIECNDALSLAMGWNNGDIGHIEYQQIIAQESRPKEQKLLHHLQLHGRVGPYESIHLRSDGSQYPVSVSSVVVLEPTAERLIWSIIEDNTEHKRVERMKQEFVATVSHELRTPLTSISGALQLMQSGAVGDLPKKAAQMLNVACKNSRRLTTLIDDLLDMEKLDSDKMDFSLVSVELQEQLLLSVEQNHGYAEAYQVTLTLALPTQSVMIHVDAHRFQQVMSNLISNACKFSPTNCVVSISAACIEDKIRISVADQGPGIPKAFEKTIFQKFAQADSTDTRKKGGTGLGLAITKKLVEKMGGSIFYKSEQDSGTEFFIELPALANARQDGAPRE